VTRVALRVLRAFLILFLSWFAQEFLSPILFPPYDSEKENPLRTLRRACGPAGPWPPAGSWLLAPSASYQSHLQRRGTTRISLPVSYRCHATGHSRATICAGTDYASTRHPSKSGWPEGRVEFSRGGMCDAGPRLLSAPGTPMALGCSNMKARRGRDIRRARKAIARNSLTLAGNTTTATRRTE
jgi:hypothetical protein